MRGPQRAGSLVLARAVAAMLLGLFSLLAASCIPRVEPDVVVWHSYRGAEATAIQHVVDTFHEIHPDILVEVVPIPYQAYSSKLASAIPRGNGPDVFLFAQERIGAWSASGLIQAVGSDIGDELLAEIAPPMLDACTWQEELWAVPVAFKNVALFYNREQLAALGATPPTTTDEMIALARRFNDPDAGRFGLVYQIGDFYFHAPWIFGFGGSLVGEDGLPRLAGAELEASLDFVNALQNEWSLLPRDSGYNVVKDRFATGNALFVIQGPWFLGELEGVDFGVAPLPTVSATGLPARPLLTVESAFLSGHTLPERRANALLLMEYLAGYDASVVRAVEGRQNPANTRALQDPRVAQDPELAPFAQAGLNGVAMPNHPAMQVIWEPANRILEQTLRGDRDRTTILEDAARDLNIALTPPPPPTSPTPWIVLLSVVLVGVAAWSVVRARKTGLVGRMAEQKWAYAYIAPAALTSGLLIFVPFFTGAAISFFAHENGEFTFVGLSNFIRILTSSDFGFWEPRSFWFTLGVTVLWTLLNVTLHVSIGLALAMLLRDPWVRMRGVYRVLLIVPWAVPNYITALIWKSLFNFNFGAINHILGLFGVTRVDWFSQFSTAFTANLVTNTWLGFPFMMVVSLGALQAIPRDLEDAAEVDGASKWQRFRHITFPLLKPALIPAIVLGSVWTFNMFNIIYLVSEGGPDSSTDILITEAYRWAFQRQEQYGYAAAYGVLIFGVLLLYTRLTTPKKPAEDA
jgi:arabinogalactan oligomer / maltooligosaccharide transport system permease protein